MTAVEEKKKAEVSPENHQGNILKLKLKELSITTEQLANAVGKSIHAIYKLTAKSKFSRDELSLICMHLPVTAKDFGEDADFFNGLYKESETHLDLAVTFVGSDKDSLGEHSDYGKFLERYFQKLEKLISLANDHIVIVDYLADNWHLSWASSHNRIFDKFHQLYEHYLEKIERLLEDKPNLVYKRYLQLPLSEIDRGTKFEDPHLRAADLCYPESLKHFKRCFLLNDASDEKRFELKILDTPIRMFSYLIIDNYYIVTEMDTIQNKTDLLPDMLFFESANHSSIRNLIDNHCKQLDDIELRKLPISLDGIADLKVWLSLAYNKYQNEKNSLIKDAYNMSSESPEELASKLGLIDGRIEYTKQKLDSIS